MYKKYETEFVGEKISFEFGKLAHQANQSVLVRQGGTAVLVTVTASKSPKEGFDFFPLSIDYEEKLYSVGKIPGGFKKREGRPADAAVLIGRAIDRPLRPLFPEDLRNEVVISCLVLSVDQDFPPDILSMIGSSLAVTTSDIPFNGPLAAIEVGYIDKKIVLNPKEEERGKSELKLTLAASKEKIIMIEAGANELTNEEMMDAIKEGHKEIQKLLEFFDVIQKEIGKEKFEYEEKTVNEELLDIIRKAHYDEIKSYMKNTDKQTLDFNLSNLTDKIVVNLEEAKEEFESLSKLSEIERLEKESEYKKSLNDVITYLEKEILRKQLLEEDIRVDGRGRDDVRELSSEIDLFERTHGSGLFARGETQVLSITTLGKLSEEQRLDGLDDVESKRYMHQYNFPGYSVGEARSNRGTNRREIGHGSLAEKALEPVIPSEEEFPYAIRVVSEIMSSNGSTSQAAVCGSTLALMAAGVPIKKPVAGISAGLFTAEDGSYKEVTDIQGIEDFFGDMDFKVAGTVDGITAIQVDIKNDGLTYEQIEEAFERTLVARRDIINNSMVRAIEKPREEVSDYALKISYTSVDPTRIGELIGPGGKNINRIIEETGTEIDIEDDGRVLIYGDNKENLEKALQMVEDSVKTYEVGDIVTGTVVNIVKFGAFIDLGGGTEGLLHISKISNKRINNVEDVLKVGEEITVKVAEVDDNGKIGLDRKSLFEE